MKKQYNALRGEGLDKRIKAEIEKMLEEGYSLSPIYPAAVAKRLGLKSRGALSLPSRKAVIEGGLKLQLQQAGLDASGKRTRNTLQQQYEELKEKVSFLERQRDELSEKLAMIINGLQAKGLVVEEFMMPLRILT